MIPDLSVVLPVRNAEHTLGEALESCRGQTFERLELLVVLNGCEDGSAEIAARHAGEDGRVRVLESAAEGGVTEAQRVGVAAARAAVVARMDADDVSHPTRLQKQWALLAADPALAAVGCGVRLIQSEGEGMERYVDWVNSLATPEAVARERFVECPVIQPSMMMRREALELVGGYEETAWAEDHDLILRMLARGLRIGKVEEVLLDWRDGPERLTRSHAMYEEDQVWRMKAHHLARLPQVRERGVVIAGAGPIGKRLGRLLGEEGVGLQGFFEVNVRRIGQQIGGVPVGASEEMGARWREAVLLSAVGVPGGREKVRRLALGVGFEEGEDFWCCC